MPSEIDICNLALSRIGARRITTLTDQSESARACNGAWEFIRDEVLRSHPWNCVSARASLAALGTDPVHGYAKQYEKPGGCLRVLEVDTTLTWITEGDMILTDAVAPIDIRYIERVTNTARYDSVLVSGLAYRLAAEICERLTQNKGKRELAWTEYLRIIGVGKGVDAQESSPMPIAEDTYLQARDW